MSRDLKNKVEVFLSSLEFGGSTLADLDAIDSLSVGGGGVVLVLNVKRLGGGIEDCKSLIRRSLGNQFNRVDFVETEKRESGAVEKKKFHGIKKVILVSSGKGGVGKTTITYYIASLLSGEGKRVGVLDADIYGPSVPVIAEISEEPKANGGKFTPVEKGGVKYNSIGFLIPKDKSLVWRGPMITKALHKLFNSTDWGELDYLLIDMPPGTGDIHLTICQTYHVDKVVMVTTPSNLAEADVSRAEDMYNKLGLNNQLKICNMAYIEDDRGRSYPFGRSDEKYQLPLTQRGLADDSLKRSLSAVISSNFRG